MKLPKVKQDKLTFSYFITTLRLNHYDHTNWEYWHKEYKQWIKGEEVSEATENIMDALEDYVEGDKKLIEC